MIVADESINVAHLVTQIPDSNQFLLVDAAICCACHSCLRIVQRALCHLHKAVKICMLGSFVMREGPQERAWDLCNR